LLNRIRNQHDFHTEKHLSNVVPENHWWEHMVLHKVDLTNSTFSVISIHHANPLFLDACTELVHSLCGSKDLLSRLSANYLGLLVNERGEAAQHMFDVLEKMIEIYPWERKKLHGALPDATLHTIVSFPFTLELLEDMSWED
jgi:hypothetical protein